MSTEVSVATTYCVVYALADSTWKLLDEGWSQVHLYHDSSDGMYIKKILYI